MSSYSLVVIRHGQSDWNKQNRFTGWVDVPLSPTGKEEARIAAQLLKEEAFVFDYCFCSVQQRAIQTLWILLEAMNTHWLPTQKTWRLNERHYGALQGLNKSETLARHGEEQVKIWRRSYDVPPPLLQEGDTNHPKFDRRYKQVAVDQLPIGESLRDVVARVKPYWQTTIWPLVRSEKKVIISAHGNSLRALAMLLMDMTPQQIVECNIPTAEPLVFALDQSGRGTDMQYINNPETIRNKQRAVASQAASASSAS